MTNKNEQRKVPELRFPEFSGEWEEKLLKEVTRINRKTDEIQNQFIYIDLESVEKGRLTKIKEVSKKYAPSRAQRVIEIGDILFQTVRPYQQNHFLYDELFTNKQVVASTGYAQIRTLEQIYEKFIYQIFYSNKFSQKVDNKCTGTSYPAINASDLGSISISIPTYKEQQKIGEFFSKLDRQIELEEKKLALLEEQKKGYMQKIFSQELRFKDENGEEYPEWETKKISEILKERNEKSSEGDMLSVTINSGIVKFEDLNKKDNSSDDKSSYKKVEIGDIAYNSMRMWQGANGVSKFNGYVSPAYTVLKKNKELDMDYIGYYFKTNKMIYEFKKNSQGLTSDTWNLKYPLLSKIQIDICCKQEQNKISNFLNALSLLIRKSEIKIESLQKMKQYLLNKLMI